MLSNKLKLKAIKLGLIDSKLKLKLPSKNKKLTSFDKDTINHFILGEVLPTTSIYLLKQKRGKDG